MIINLNIKNIDCPVCGEQLRNDFNLSDCQEVCHQETNEISCKNCESKIEFDVELDVTFYVRVDSTAIDPNQISLF